MLSLQERCAMLTVGARLCECVVPVRTAVIFLEPHWRHPHMGVTVTRHPELLEHEAMAGAACANPPCTATTRWVSALLGTTCKVTGCSSWRWYRVWCLEVCLLLGPGGRCRCSYPGLVAGWAVRGYWGQVTPHRWQHAASPAGHQPPASQHRPPCPCRPAMLATILCYYK